MRRSFKWTVRPVTPSTPSKMRESIPAVAATSSISARFDGSPRMSMSHCVNWRKRPFCGLSARHTLPICNDLNGEGSDSRLFA